MILEKLDEKVELLLKDEKILDKFVNEINKKVAGEKDTIEAIFLILMSAWVKNLSSQQHAFVNSESSAGKSYICKQIVKILPDDRYEYRTKITPEVLSYWHNSTFEPEWTWDGKILYLEDVKDEVINSPTFKVMASEGSTATVVIKQRAIDIKIEGNPIIIVTSADSSPNSELLNRFSIINLDETPNQTKMIMKKQAEISILGKSDDYEPFYKETLKRLLRCDVRLPEWVSRIIEYFPNDVIRVRRDFPRFIDLIKASAILHQNQREMSVVTKLVYANEKDYEVARRVLKKITESGGIYGLTHRLRKCYESCLSYFKEYEEYFSVKEIHKHNPIVSERYWHVILEQLAQKGLLKVDLRKPEEGSLGKKPTTVFYPTIGVRIKLPPISKLLNEVNELKELKVVKE